MKLVFVSTSSLHSGRVIEVKISRINRQVGRAHPAKQREVMGKLLVANRLANRNEGVIVMCDCDKRRISDGYLRLGMKYQKFLSEEDDS